MRVFTTFEQLEAAHGEEIGTTDWVTIDQKQVNKFADATGDHQWIHVDVERAKSGPFGGTIAHGYLTLSLIPGLMPTVWEVHGFAMGINYGINKMRFPSPVKVGSKVRIGATLANLEEVSGGVQIMLDVTVE